MKLTVYGKPEPQGSMKAFVIAGRARLTSSNAKLKPFRQQIALSAIAEDWAPIAKQGPCQLTVDFYLAKPPSVPKKRTCPAVKPDLDKLIRAVKDSLKGIAWIDDGQVCRVIATKHYGSPERTEIEVKAL